MSYKMDKNQLLEMKKTFGLGVLLKLTKTFVKDIEIRTVGDYFVFNGSFAQLKDAVERTMFSHNIRMKV